MNNSLNSLNPHREEIQVLSPELGAHLATLIRSADGAIEDQDFPPDFKQHVFTEGDRTLVVTAENTLYGVQGNYLLILYQWLAKLVTDYDNNQEPFENAVQRIASPLREDLVRRLSLETFWHEDGTFD
jgi:hypothetical protein